MQIIVPIKQVPETNNVKMDPVTGTMVREGVEAIINPLDLYAIEAAVQLKEKFGGKITTISMGPPKAESALRESIAMGCDEAVLLTDKAFAGADTWATSYTLSQAIRRLGNFDLILCGERATDGDTGQVGPGIAAWLDLPFATYISKIEAVQDNELIVERMVETGYEVLALPKPCLLTVVKEIAYPRLPSLKGKIAARQKQIASWGPADIQAQPENIGLKGSPTRVVKITTPQVARFGKLVKPKDEQELSQALDELIAVLQEKAIL